MHVNSYSKTARIPRVGSRWVWEIDNPGACELIEVVEVKWNGEEWWVKTERLHESKQTLAALGGARGYWNDLGRFTEAVTKVGIKDQWRNAPRVKDGIETVFSLSGDGET